MATATPLPPETAVVTLGASLLFSPHRTYALWAPPFSPTFCPGHGLLTAMATPFLEEVSGTYLPSPMPDEPPTSALAGPACLLLMEKVPPLRGFLA